MTGPFFPSVDPTTLRLRDQHLPDRIQPTALVETIQDTVGSMAVGVSPATVAYNDTLGTLAVGVDAAALDPRYGVGIHAVGNSGTSLVLDASATAGYVKTITLTGNCTFTFAGASAGKVATLELVLTQDATGGRTVTWPASVRWDQGAAPALTSTANGITRIVLTSYNGGTTWLGSLAGKVFA